MKILRISVQSGLINCLNTTLFRILSRGMNTANSLYDSIQNKLTEKLKPTSLHVVNESYMHNVREGSETHFKVFIASDAFEGLTLLQRHCCVNSVLEEEFSRGLHALSIVAKTPSQWTGLEEKFAKSPPCRGGWGL